MNKNNNPNRFIKPLLAMAVTASLPALAQQSRMLEEIVITAEHREASLQDTEISLTAFSADNIAELGISSGLDIGEYVPNLHAQEYSGGRSGVSFNIRGVGNAETLVTFDPAVSVYVDGVLIPKNTGALMDMLELDRIEVLRGPQGTLYGRNTMGGAVNYITRKPTDVLEGRVSATLGRFDQRDVRGMLNVPLLGADSGFGELNMRVALGSIQRDGTQKNIHPTAPEREQGTKDREMAMVQLMWRPIEPVSVIYSYDRARVDEVPESVWITGTNPDTAAGQLLAPFEEPTENSRPSSIRLDVDQVTRTDVDGHSLNVIWDMSPNTSLHSITGFRKMENLGLTDSDGSPLAILRVRDHQEYESLSQEFRLIGSAMEHRLNYSLGMFLYSEEGDIFQETRIFDGAVNDVNIATFDNEAWAVYGQLTYALTDRWDLTVGARYTDEDREMHKVQTAGELFDGSTPFFDDIAHRYAGNQCVAMPGGVQNCANTLYPKASNSFDSVSGLISLGYNWNDDVMTYVKVSQGFQSGGFNSRDTTWSDFTTGFEEETLTAYEIGIKSSFRNRYQFNGAIFLSDYDDKRVNQFNPETLASVQRNVGVVEIWGLEMEFLAQLSDNWQVGINYGHLNQEYKKFEVPDPNNSTEIISLADRANFPYAPNNSGSAFVAYERPLDLGVIRARLNWTYRDNMTFLVPMPERNSSGSLQLWNARLSLDEIRGPGNTTARVSIWGKNLANEGYWNNGANVFDSFGFTINNWGEPRTYGVDLELRF